MDDPRNTDNAWMETTAFHFHCTEALARRMPLRAGTDAGDVMWLDIDANDPKFANLYASHREWVEDVAATQVRDALEMLPKGSEVLYADQQTGEMLEATVVKVHHDDVPPYYSIRLPSGQERETVRERLSRKAAAPPAAAAALTPVDPRDEALLHANDASTERREAHAAAARLQQRWHVHKKGEVQGKPVASASAAVDVRDLQARKIADDESAPADEAWVDVGRAKAVKKATYDAQRTFILEAEAREFEGGAGAKQPLEPPRMPRRRQANRLREEPSVAPGVLEKRGRRPSLDEKLKLQAFQRDSAKNVLQAKTKAQEAFDEAASGPTWSYC